MTVNNKKKLNSILLVDDEPATNYFHSKLIEIAGFAREIEVAQSGFEALDYLQGCIGGSIHTPEVVFMDLNMPGMDGWECVEKCKKMFPDSHNAPKIVVVTTSIHPDDKSKADHLDPIFAFYNKPLTEENLREIAEKLENVS